MEVLLHPLNKISVQLQRRHVSSSSAVVLAKGRTFFEMATRSADGKIFAPRLCEETVTMPSRRRRQRDAVSRRRYRRYFEKFKFIFHAESAPAFSMLLMSSTKPSLAICVSLNRNTSGLSPAPASMSTVFRSSRLRGNDTVAKLPLFTHATRRLSCDHEDAIEAAWHRDGAVDATST